MNISDILKQNLIQETNPDAGTQNARNHKAALKAGNLATPGINPIGGNVSQPAGTPRQMYDNKSQASGSCKQCPASKGSYAAAVTATHGVGAGPKEADGLSSIGPHLNKVSEAVLEALGCGVATIALIKSKNKK